MAKTMIHVFPLLLSVVGVVSLASPKLATQAPTFRSSADTLPIDVAVLESSGGFVLGLQREDFIVTVNGKPVDVATFDVEPRPLSMVVMVDTSLSVSFFSVNRNTNARVPHYKALLQMVSALGPKDRVRVGSFGLRVAINPAWTRDAAEVERILLEEMWAGGGSPVWQALTEAIAVLQQEPGRRVIVALTDGLDTGKTPAGEGSARMVQRLAADAGVMLYVVRPPGVKQGLSSAIKEIVAAIGGGSFEPVDSAGVNVDSPYEVAVAVT